MVDLAAELPRWYRPNPGRAAELAFILFTGEGERTRMNRITNQRFALSAFGTATSAADGEDQDVWPIKEWRRRNRGKDPQRL